MISIGGVFPQTGISTKERVPAELEHAPVTQPPPPAPYRSDTPETPSKSRYDYDPTSAPPPNKTPHHPTPPGPAASPKRTTTDPVADSHQPQDDAAPPCAQQHQAA